MSRITLPFKKKQRNCLHEHLEFWYAGGRRKARCKDCFDHGLAERLIREKTERKEREVLIMDTCICKFCGREVPTEACHLHQGEYVCEDCWDERLATTA